MPTSKRITFCRSLILIALACSLPAKAQYILETTPENLGGILARNGLTLKRVLRQGGTEGVYEVGSARNQPPSAVEAAVRNDSAVRAFETDAKVAAPEVAGIPFQASAAALGAAATDRSTSNYFGATVRSSYVNQ